MAQRLGPPLTGVAAAASDFLRASATALVLRRSPPSLQAVEASLQAYDAVVTALRNEGLMRASSTSEIERLFALGFALDQLRQNFADLARCVQEYARGVQAKNTS